MEIHAVDRFLFCVHAGLIIWGAGDTVLNNVDTVSDLWSSRTIKITRAMKEKMGDDKIGCDWGWRSKGVGRSNQFFEELGDCFLPQPYRLSPSQPHWLFIYCNTPNSFPLLVLLLPCSSHVSVQMPSPQCGLLWPPYYWAYRLTHSSSYHHLLFIITIWNDLVYSSVVSYTIGKTKKLGTLSWQVLSSSG